MNHEFPSKSFKKFSWSAIFILVLTILAAYWGIESAKPPRALPESAPGSEFSAYRAVKYLNRIAREPHPMGTEAHDKVRDYLVESLRNLGYEPEVQTAIYAEAKLQTAGRIQNIAAKLSGIHPSGKALMLCSHYDSVESSPGAGDAGAGVAAILETARALKANAPLNQYIRFLLTDAEEDSLQGARAFVQEHPWAKDVGLVLNFEARGTRGIVRMLETSHGNSHLIREFIKAAPRPWSNSFALTLVQFVPHNTDLGIFMAAGSQGLNFGFMEGQLDFHMPQDRVSNLSLDSLQHLGTYALSLARHFGKNGIPDRSSEDAIYFNLAGYVILRYSRAVAVGIAFIIIVLGTGVGILGFKKRILNTKRFFVSLPLLLLELILAAAMAFLFKTAVAASHGSWLPAGPYSGNHLYFLAFVFLVLTISFSFFTSILSKIGWENMAYAAGLILAALACVLTVRFPGASYPIAWPAGLYLLGLLFYFIFRGNRPSSVKKTAIAGLAAILTALIGTPIIYLVFLATGFTGASTIALAVLASLFLWIFIPVFDLLGRRRKALGTLLAAGIFLAFTAAGALTTKYTERHPRWTALDYWLDLDSQTASWLTTIRTPKELVREIMPHAQSGHPMDIPPYRSTMYLNAQAPMTILEPPIIEKEHDIVQGDIRILKLHLASPRIAREMMVFGREKEILSAEVEGKTVMDTQAGQNRLILWLPNPGKEGYRLTIKAKAGAPISFMVRERLLGIPGETRKFLPPVPAKIFLKTSTTIRKTFLF